MQQLKFKNQNKLFFQFLFKTKNGNKKTIYIGMKNHIVCGYISKFKQTYQINFSKIKFKQKTSLIDSVQF